MSTASGPPDSPFARAVDQYIQSRRAKSKAPSFIDDLQQQRNEGKILDQKAVKLAMMQLEKDATDKTSARVARNTLNPVIRCLSDYSSIVDVLVQADPMPTALIWGALKAVIQASSRFLELYDKIKEQLIQLSIHIETLILFEEEFGESSTMQDLMQTSYFHIIRFWHRVEKECRRQTANRLARATFSFSISKINGIIDDIKRVAEAIGLLDQARII